MISENDLKAFLRNSLDHPFFSIQKRQMFEFECFSNRWNFNFFMSEAVSPHKKQLSAAELSDII